MDPQPVAGKQIGNLSNGKGDAIALHMHVNLRPGQIEWRGICPDGRRGGQNCKQRIQTKQRAKCNMASHDFYCTDARPSVAGCKKSMIRGRGIAERILLVPLATGLSQFGIA